MKFQIIYIHPIMKTTHEQIINSTGKVKAEKLFLKRFLKCPEIVSITKLKEDK